MAKVCFLYSTPLKSPVWSRIHPLSLLYSCWKEEQCPMSCLPQALWRILFDAFMRRQEACKYIHPSTNCQKKFRAGFIPSKYLASAVLSYSWTQTRRRCVYWSRRPANGFSQSFCWSCCPWLSYCPWSCCTWWSYCACTLYWGKRWAGGPFRVMEEYWRWSYIQNVTWVWCHFWWPPESNTEWREAVWATSCLWQWGHQWWREWGWRWLRGIRRFWDRPTRQVIFILFLLLINIL